MIIGVIGGSECSKEVYEMAVELGREIGRRGYLLICGGLGGVMEGVCKGSKMEGGVTIGVLPGNTKEEANSWVDIPIVTGMGVARNVIIIRTAEVVIALPGRYGTLSEIGFALNLGTPIVGLRTWEIEGIQKVNSPYEAVEVAIRLGRRGK
jgi:hypothetical protein